MRAGAVPGAPLPGPDHEAPADLSLEHYEGHLLLRSTSSIDSVGAGPIEITGRRNAPGHMRVRQRIYRRGGGSILVQTGAELRHGLPRWRL